MKKLVEWNLYPLVHYLLLVEDLLWKHSSNRSRYYSGRDIYYLTPKIEMTDIQKLYYCRCLRLNKYKYNYGRQANKTLGSIFIPEIFEIPKNLLDLGMPTIENFGDSIKNRKLILDPSNWNYFTYDDIFIIERGESVYLQDMLPGKYPYISATSRNNGISSYVDVYNRNGNVIVVNYDGSIGEAFYQEGPFFASEKVATIKLKDYELNQYIAFFIITLIKKEKFRFNYGLKWSINKRMKKSIIKLPVTSSGQIDFPFMEEYIKSLSFSANI